MMRQDPVGKTIKLAGLERAPAPDKNPNFEIIGVVSDIKNHDLRAAVLPQAGGIRFAPLIKIGDLGHSSYDHVTLGAVIILLAAIGFLACCLAALRATRVDPVTALRQE